MLELLDWRRLFDSGYTSVQGLKSRASARCSGVLAGEVGLRPEQNMNTKLKLVAKRIPVAEARARESELRQLYYRVRLMLGDDATAARANADKLLKRSLSTGIIVELAQGAVDRDA
jgi:hypothetical protein